MGWVEVKKNFLVGTQEEKKEEQSMSMKMKKIRYWITIALCRGR